jgi:hypothetical protein
VANQDTTQTENFIRVHMRHQFDPALPDCDACTDELDEIIFNDLEKVHDASLIQDLWDYCNFLIDSDYELAGNIVCWKRPIATHPLASQTVFNSYTRELLLEWDLQDWDDWVLDPWQDMREVIGILNSDSRFLRSGATVEDLARQVHEGHCRFSICEGEFQDCEQCGDVVTEFARN